MLVDNDASELSPLLAVALLPTWKPAETEPDKFFFAP